MNTASFLIAGLVDAPAIATLVNEAYRPKDGRGGWTHESSLISGSRIDARQVEALIARPNSAILIAKQQTDIVACVHIEKEGTNAHIGMLAVSPSFQGTGIGKQLLAHAEETAAARFLPARFVMAVVSLRSELLAFYIRRGYKPTGETLPYPVDANVGSPIDGTLKLEVLHKSAQT